MNNGAVKLSEEAKSDFDAYIDYIAIECDSPLTASRHQVAIIRVLLSLSKNHIFKSVHINSSFSKYGLNVQRVNYKKMAIIYTVHEKTVYVHRIIPQSMVAELE